MRIPQESLIPASDFIIIGGTGDLALRKILPALFYRFIDNQIPDGCGLIIAARRLPNRAEFLARLKNFCDIAIATSEWEIWEKFCSRLSLVKFDVEIGTGAEEIKKICEGTKATPRIFYLAISPSLFGIACQTLKKRGLATSLTRLVVEKPLGHDLASACEVDNALLSVFKETQVYRIDHYLGKETVQNLMALRFANSLFESQWTNASISNVQISVAESVGVGSRASYYDRFGALRDMVQNHLLQLLCLVAMEPPARFNADEVRNEKLRVLRALKPIKTNEFDRLVKLGQYSSGEGDDSDLKSYVEEVGNQTTTETFVAMRVEIENWRWSGVPFYLRTGKRLARRASEIVITFRQPPHNIFSKSGKSSTMALSSNKLIIRLQPNEGIRLGLTSKAPGPGGMRLRPASLNLSFSDTFKERIPEAYERLLMDVARGNQTLFMSSNEVEAAWRWIDPIIEQASFVQPELYSSRSWGPISSFELMAEHGVRWIEPEADL